MPKTNPFINLGSSYEEDGKILFGSPSPFVKLIGNPHEIMCDYRAAGYWELGI